MGKAVKTEIGAGLFWRLLVGTVVMLAFGYLGEQSYINPWVGFAVGMAGWVFILYSLHVGMLVTLIAAVHYFYMREYWVTVKQTPIVYRYIDWSLTVPLQMIEFYCILKEVKQDLG